MRLKPSEKRLLSLLSGYWCLHPHASDSADGVTRWWIPEGFEHCVSEVEMVLRWMESHGLIDRVKLSDGVVRFRRRPDISNAVFEQTVAASERETD